MAHEEQRIAQRFAALAPEARRAFLARMRDKGLSFAELPIAAADRGQPLPLSHAQQGLWLTWQMDPDSPAYNLPGVLWLEGLLDVGALQRSLDEVVARHESLRTVFGADDNGQGVQKVRAPAPVDLPLIEAQGSDDDATRAWAQAFATQPFRLDREGPFRAVLRRTDAHRHQLALAVHHIAADGQSLAVLIDELVRLYEAHATGRQAMLPPVPIQAVDHAVWQRHWMEAGEKEHQLAHWRARLGDDHPVLALPMDRVRGTGAPSREGRHAFRLSRALSQDLRAVARASGMSLYMMMLSAFALALHRFSGQTDLRIGVPISGRQRAETVGLVAHLVNVQVLRVAMNPLQGFETLLDQVRDALLDAQEHRDLPFDLLVEALAPARQPGVHPLFQVKCTELPPLPEARQAGGLSWRLQELSGGQAHFDLSFDFIDRADGVEGVFSYAAALFDQATMARLADAMVGLLAEAVEHPARPLQALALPGPVSVLQGASTRPAASDALADDVLALWRLGVVADPGALAVQTGELLLTRGALDAQAEALAQRLIAQGIGPEDRVGVLADRSPAFVLGLLAVLKAGGVCVPLDPALPADRLQFQCADSGARLVLAAQAPTWPVQGPVLTLALDMRLDTALQARAAVPMPRPDPRHAAYVIYTSGSTGRPKGVAISHGALAAYVHGVLARLDLPASARAMGMVSTVAADLGHTVLFGALCSGRVLHLLPSACAFDPDAFAAYMREHRIDVLKIVPSHLQALLQAATPADVLPGHALVVGGESMPAALLARIRTLKPGCRIVNHYGPTETTVGVLTHEATSDDMDGLPLGTPLCHAQAFVLDAWLNPVPMGVAGELYLGGDGLGRGYLGRPGLTAERFVAHPQLAGQRLYRSGDQVRQRADGRLEFLGRLDDQVKIRGHRVELREVAEALQAQAGVREAHVVARPSAEGALQLHGYVVPAQDAGLPDDWRATLMAGLVGVLAEHMLPSSLTVLQALPLTPNGKVDRQALPEPEQASASAAWEAPHAGTEQALAALWAEVLGIERVGRADNFFALGGDSILVLKVVARARKRSLGLLPRQLFDQPCLQDLAELIDRTSTSASTSAPVAAPAATVPRLADDLRRGGVAMSHAQERLWFLWQLEPGSTAYHIAGARTLDGALDTAALCRAFDALVSRHEALRTVFREAPDGQVRQVVLDASAADVEQVDLRSLQGDALAAGHAQALARIHARPFDLAEGPLLRAGLLRTGDGAHTLVLAMHHIVSDGWSMDIIVDELSALYQAFTEQREPAPRPLPIQYADHAVWLRQWLAQGEGRRQMAYWQDQLAGEQPVLQLPTDRPRRGLQGWRAARCNADLPEDLATALRARANAAGTTLFVVMLAAFQALLYRLSGQADVRVGVPVANRDRAETQGIVGVFVNTQVHRNRLDGQMSLADVLARAREAAAGAREHQDLPFEHLVEALQPQRSLGHTPLFQVMFNHQRVDGRTRDRLGTLVMRPCALGDQAAQFELSLDTQEDQGRLSLSMSYAAELFDATTAERFTRHYLRLLRAFAEQPQARLGDAAMLPDDELTRVRAWGDRLDEVVADQVLVHRRIEAQARLAPEATALVLDGQCLSHGELNRRANRLAHHLATLGVGPDARVGVAMARSLDMVVALLAVLKAGAAYVPLDPRYPQDRLAWMVEDSSLRWVLTEAETFAAMPSLHGVQPLIVSALAAQALPEHDPVPALHPDLLAYVIYTSGSTGRPKGVAMTHRAFAAHAEVSIGFFGLTARDRMLQFATLNFDGCIEQIYPPLCVGAAVVLRGPDMWDARTFHRQVIEHGVTVADLTTAYWFLLVQEFARDGVRGHGQLRQVHAGGEAMPPEGIRAWREAGLSHVRLLNTYGPTEAAVTAAVLDCASYVDGDEPVPAQMPIGVPLAGRRLCVVDQDMNLAPVGVPGELCIGGALLARGYLRRGGLTADRFIADPFDDGQGGRLYRTGDLVRWLADGRLEYLGRLDHQVKVRGFRVELGEIESSLLAQPGVREAVVVARGAAGATRLVAYVSPDGGTLDVQALKVALLRELPDHMVPSAIVPMQALPLNANGKIDRAALPEPVVEALPRDEAQAPAGEVEVTLARLWAEVLGSGPVARDAHFFELGGHSLLATQLVSRVRQAFGRQVALAMVFERPVLSDFARGLEALVADVGAMKALASVSHAPAMPPLEAEPGREQGPLSFAQQRLWFRWQLEPQGSAFNMALAVRLQGRIDMDALSSAFDLLAQRHAVLRTVFREEGGEPVQQVLPPAPVEIPLLMPSSAQALQSAVEAEAARPFDLGRDLPWRVRLFRQASDEHVLLVTMHHIATDGWSIGHILREFTQLYAAGVAGTPASLPGHTVRYLDYARWQRDWLDQGEGERQLAYWRARLARRGPVLALPPDLPAPAERAHRAALTERRFSAPLGPQLKAFAQAQGLTPFMPLLAALSVVFARASGQPRFVIGTDIANRNHVATEHLVGFFVNQIVLDIDCDTPKLPSELLSQVKTTLLEAADHQDLPFDRLVGALRVKGRGERAPLFDVKVLYEDRAGEALSLPGLAVAPHPVGARGAELDLVVSFVVGTDALDMVAKYDDELFRREAIDGLLQQTEAVLSALLAQPDLPLSHLTAVAGEVAQARRTEALQAQQARQQSMASRLGGLGRRAAV